MTDLGFSAYVADDQAGDAVVMILGELDMAAAPELEGVLEPAIVSGRRVELDMRACSFVDSTGIATLVKAARRLHADGRMLKIKGAQERVRGIFELTGLLAQGWIEFEPDDQAEAN